VRGWGGPDSQIQHAAQRIIGGGGTIPVCPLWGREKKRSQKDELMPRMNKGGNRVPKNMVRIYGTKKKGKGPE